MSYQLIYPWRKHPRLVQVQFSDTVSADDLEACFAQILSLMDNSEATIHILFDFNPATQLPVNLHELLKKNSVIRHAQSGHWVFLQPNEFVSFAASNGCND